jgi:hypothetical protein
MFDRNQFSTFVHIIFGQLDKHDKRFSYTDQMS